MALSSNGQYYPAFVYPGRLFVDADGIINTDSLSVLNNGRTKTANFIGGRLELVGALTQYTFVGDGGQPGVVGIFAGGSRATPSAVTSGNTIGLLSFGGQTGAATSRSGSATIAFVATENWSTSASGSRIDFTTTVPTTNTNAVRLTIDNTSITSGSGVSFVGNLTGNTTGAHNGTVGATTPNTGAFTTVTTSGNTYVGNTGPSTVFDFRLEVVGGGNGTALFSQGSTGNDTISVWNRGTSGNNVFAQFYTETAITARGSITYNRAGGLTAYNTTSDARFKENIADASTAIDTVKALKVRSYDWKLSESSVPFGFVAQELYQVYPTAVTPGDTNLIPTKTWGIDNSILVPMLTKAIQELTQRIEQLEKK